MLVGGVALAARLGAIVALARVPLWRTPSLDSLEYVQLAEQLRRLSWPAYAPHAPGYPAFIAILLALGASLTAVRVVQAGFGALTCVLAARLAARSLDRRALLPTGLLLAIYGPLVIADVAILAEGPFLLALMIALNLSADSDGRTTSWIGTGAAIGAATMIRPTALALAPVFAAILLWQSRGRRAAWKSIGALLAGLLLVLVPLNWHNWREEHVVGVQGWGGMNLYIGNAPHGTGRASVRPGPAWDELEGAAGRAGASTPQAAEAYYVRRTIAEIREAPSAYARLLGRKLIWLTQADEIRDTHSFYFFASAVPPIGWLPSFGMLAALAMVGLVEAYRRSRVSPWIVGYVVAMGATSLLLVIGSRYRLPLVPVLAAVAGAALVWTADAVRARHMKMLAWMAALGLVVFVVAHTHVDPSSHVFAEEWTLTAEGLVRQGDLVGAEAACRRALDIDPKSAFALDELGMIYFQQGRTDLAHSSLTAATTAGPMYAGAWYHIGLLERQSGDHPRAVDAFRRSLSVTPERVDVVAALGQELLATHDLAGARPLLEKVVARAPDDGRTHFALALIALDQGRMGDAIAEATTTTRLLPGYGRAWLLLARAALAGDRAEAAEQALTTADQRGADRREVLAGQVAILLRRGGRDEAQALVSRAAGGDAAVAASIWRDAESW